MKRKPIPYSERPSVPPLTKEQEAAMEAEIQALMQMKDEEIDLSGIGELTDEDFKKMSFFYERPIKAADKMTSLVMPCVKEGLEETEATPECEAYRGEILEESCAS